MAYFVATIKPQSKVTIHYRCAATRAEVKGDAAATPANAEKLKQPAGK